MCECSCESFLPGERIEVEIVPMPPPPDEANTGDSVKLHQALNDDISLGPAFRHTERVESEEAQTVVEHFPIQQWFSNSV